MNMGRPRSFDLDQALDRALLIFWRVGYEGASLNDLTEAMGINPPSLYAAFGSKEGLFRQALDRYMEKRSEFLRQAFARPTAREVAAYLLSGTANLQTVKNRPRGCLLVQGALACKDAAEPIRNELAQRRAAGEAALADRFRQAIDAGDLTAAQDPGCLASYIMTVMQGMAVKAAGGASGAELQQIVDLALAVFPPPAPHVGKRAGSGAKIGSQMKTHRAGSHQGRRAKAMEEKEKRGQKRSSETEPASRVKAPGRRPSTTRAKADIAAPAAVPPRRPSAKRG